MEKWLSKKMSTLLFGWKEIDRRFQHDVGQFAGTPEPWPLRRVAVVHVQHVVTCSRRAIGAEVCDVSVSDEAIVKHPTLPLLNKFLITGYSL